MRLGSKTKVASVTRPNALGHSSSHAHALRLQCDRGLTPVT